MLKMTIIGFLIALSSFAQAQVDVTPPEPRQNVVRYRVQTPNEYYQEIKEQLNPLKCQRNEWGVIIDKNRSDAVVLQVMNLIVPPKNAAWTSIANFLEVDPGIHGDGLIHVDRHGDIRVRLREIKHVAVPSSYSNLKNAALKKLAADLKSIPGVHFHCVVYAAMGARLSGSNKRENIEK